MKIYADPISVNCRKVLAGLELIGLPFERVHVGYFAGEQKSEAFMAMNPNAAMPVAVDGDFSLHAAAAKARAARRRKRRRSAMAAEGSASTVPRKRISCLCGSRSHA